jgi:DNA-binding transcriptional LysR family regulator
MIMQLDQLKYLIEVAKTSSISEASQNLHVSQSAISQSITHLESELGVKIFIRSRQGTIPTPDGKKIIKKAFEVLQKIEELEAEAKDSTKTITGELKLSTIPGLMLTIIKTLRIFKEAYPKVNIEIKEKGSHDIITDLVQNKADIGLTVMYDELFQMTTNLEFKRLMDGQVKVYVRKDSPLAFSEKVHPQELIRYPIVLYKSNLGTRLIQKLEKGFGPVNLLYVSDSTDAIIKAILEGLAVSLIPEFALQDDRHVQKGEVVGLEMDDFSYKISFGWVWPKRQNLSAPALKFIEYLNSELKKNHPIHPS